MDAPLRWSLQKFCIVPLAICLLACRVDAAGYRTANFTVDAPTPQLAKEIGDAAERCRKELAIEWLGEALPRWPQPCPIKAQVAPNLGAGGATSFVFDRGRVFGWRMNIQGSRERLLDSVVPHEVTHTIFASYFRKPLPRWADEGACTTVEHASEVSKQEKMLIEFLQSRRGIPFSSMFAMKEYPDDVLPLYAQGHSLAHFLISQQGKREFISFLEDGLQDENWPRAIHDNYGYRNLVVLQDSWLDWVRNGRPELQVASNGNTRLASATTRGQSDVVVRGQSPAPAPQRRNPHAVNGPLESQPHGSSVASDPWSSSNPGTTLASNTRSGTTARGGDDSATVPQQNQGNAESQPLTVYEELSRSAMRP